MEKFSFFLFLFFSINSIAQIAPCNPNTATVFDSIFTSLRGFEDKNGEVFLYYRVEQSRHYNCQTPYTEYSKDIFCYNISKNTNHMKYYETGGYYDVGIPFTGWYSGTTDFEFIGKDTSNLFVLSFGCGVDCDFGITKYFNNSISGIGSYFNIATNIEISNQDTNLIICEIFNNSFITYNGSFENGFYSPEYSKENISSIGIFPTNDSLMVGVYSDWKKNALVKSYDRGNTFQTIDSTIGWNIENKTKPCQFSSDGSVIYTSTSNYPIHQLVVSKDFGESWKVIYSDSSQFYFSFAPNNPSQIFITKENSILKSDDYGSTFSPYQTVKEDFLGIYKHPSQDLVYAITKNNLYELSDSKINQLLKITTDITESQKESENFILYHNYPNPFNPTTQIRFFTAKTSQIKITIYDNLGRIIEILRNEVFSPGNHSVDFNPINLSSGVYYYSVQSDNFAKTNKMILLR